MGALNAPLLSGFFNFNDDPFNLDYTLRTKIKLSPIDKHWKHIYADAEALHHRHLDRIFIRV